MKKLFAIGIILLSVFTNGSGAQRALPRVQPDEVVWMGAFRLPPGTFGTSRFDYGGWALAYNQINDSLFIVGHDWQHHIAEISIPEVRKGTSLAQLATATIRQPFADATEGRLVEIGGYPNHKIGGLLVFDGRLVGAGYSYFDAEGGAKASHFTRSLSLGTAGTVTGMHRVGSLNPAFYAGGMAVVPDDWRVELGGPAITGGCCIPIIGRTSYGPAAFAFDPAKLPATSSAPAVPLVYYPGANPLRDWAASNTAEFNGSTEMAGVFIPKGTRSLLFVGRQGTGPFCYRCGAPDSYCRDDIQAPPYQVQVWAYDLNDLAAVRARKRQPWDVRPYAVWALTGNTHPTPLPFFSRCMRVHGVAYDPVGGRVWITAQNGDGDLPVIHMFRVSIG